MANQFLVKETMADMRALSAAEITALQNGTYEGVQLLGYYEKGDTPAPIIYYYVNPLNDPDPGLDDNGSVIATGGIKLAHHFIEKVESSYFGIQEYGSANVYIDYCLMKGLDISLSSNVTVNKTFILNVNLIGNGYTIKAVGISTDYTFSSCFILRGEQLHIKDVTFDHNGSPAKDASCNTMLFLNGANFCTVKNVEFKNFGALSKIPSSPPLLLVSKDIETDYSQGIIAKTQYNTFDNIRFYQNIPSKLSFAIRIITNWERNSTEPLINETKGNIFRNLHISGDFYWNTIEFAGTGTCDNIVQNSKIDGLFMTAIDFDKGCYNNIMENNVIDGGICSYGPGNMDPNNYLFCAVTDQSYQNHRTSGNKILNNRIFIQPYDTIRPYESVIAVRGALNSVVEGNYIETNNSYTCGILLDANINNLIITNNTIKALGSYGIRYNANSSNLNKVKIVNNFIESQRTAITLSPTSEGSNDDLIIEGNTIKNIIDAHAVSFSNMSNVRVVNNVIENNYEKIQVGLGVLYCDVNNNFLKGSGTLLMRINSASNIFNNTRNSGAGNQLIGTALDTSNIYNNNWQINFPFIRNDYVSLGNNASTIPAGFWNSKKSITLSTISNGVGYPSTEGLVITFQNGGGEITGNFTRSFDIFKSYNQDGLFVRRYAPNGSPLSFKRLDLQASSSSDSAVMPGNSYTQSEVEGILVELRDLKTKLRTAGILAS